MRVRTFFEWQKLSSFLRKRTILSKLLFNWSYTIADGYLAYFQANKIYLMTFEERVQLNLRKMKIYLSYQTLRKYEKR